MYSEVRQKSLRLKWLWLGIGVVYILYAIYVTLEPNPPTVFSRFLFDKAYHFLGYFCMMGWFALIYPSVQTRIILALTFILLGASLEILQGLGGTRDFEVADMFANGLGVAIAWLLSLTPLRQALVWFEIRVLRLA